MARRVVFCSHCARDKGWQKPAIRTTTDACDICGGHEQIRVRRRGVISVQNMKNFEHGAQFLPGTSEEARLQEPIS